MKKNPKSRHVPVARNTSERIICQVRDAIDGRLKELGKTKHWLAQQMKVRPATVYEFLGGKGATVSTLEKMLAVLDLKIEIKPKK